MSQVHEIKRLTINIDGTNKLPSSQRIQSIVEPIIEEYFDRYGLIDFDILFDSIELDLGEIDLGDFEPELNVRVRYLLNEELKGFFEQAGIEEQIKSNFRLNLTELFEDYLKTGINRQSNEPLSTIFSKLFTHDPESITSVLQQSASWSIIKNRLFEQVDFPSYESYWIKRYGIVYNSIRRINHRILLDFSANPMTDYGYHGLQGVLKKLTFDFMLGSNFAQPTEKTYFALLRRSLHDLDAYSNRISESLSAYISNLEDHFTLGKFQYSGKADSSESGGWMAQDIIVTFLTYGRTPNELDTKDLIRLIQGVSISKLRTILQKVIPSLSEAGFVSRLSRFHQILSPDQLIYSYGMIAEQLSGNYKNRVSLIANLAILIERDYKENIFYLPTIFYQSYYQNQTKSDFLSGHTMVEIIKYVSAKQTRTPLEIAEKIMFGLIEASNPNLVSIRKATAQVVEDFNNNDETSNHRIRQGWSELNLVLHYLRTGIWLPAESTPQQELLLLLDSDEQGLSNALFDLVELPSVWIRLIHQFPLKQVHTLFSNVFGLDPAFGSLMEAIQIAQISGNEEVERQLLDAFVNIQSRLRSKENKGYTGNYQLEFTRILIPLGISQYADSSLNFDDSLTKHIENWIANPSSLPGVKARSQIFTDALNQTRELHSLLNQLSFEQDMWHQVLAGLSKELVVDLIDRIREVVVIHELRALTEALNDKRFVRIYSESDLISILIFSARGQKESIVRTLRNGWKRINLLKKIDSEALEKEVLINVSQKEWMGINEPSINLGSFIKQLERIIHAGTFQKSDSFDSWSDFEFSLRKYIETREPRIIEYFEGASQAKVLGFLLSLQPIVISAMKVALDIKFKHSDYVDVIFALRARPTLIKKNIDCVIVAYGFRNKQFNRILFTRFVNQWLPQLNLPLSVNIIEDRIEYSYVRATVHFLQFHRWINSQAELDGIEEALFKSLVEYRDLFSLTISSSFNSKQILNEVIISIPSNRWPYFMSLLLDRNQDEVERFLTQFDYTKAVQLEKLVSLIDQALKTRSSRSLDRLTKSDFKIKKFTVKESRQIANIDEAEMEDPISAKQDLPNKILRIGIHKEYLEDFDVFQLIEEVVSTGIYPDWSEVQSALEFEKLLLTIQKLTPQLFKQLLNSLFLDTYNALNLLSVLGSTRFLSVMDSILDNNIVALGELADQLTMVHQTFGTKESLKNYFLQKLIQVSWVFQPSQSEKYTSLVMASVAIDFAISTDEYRELLARGSLLFGKGKEQEMISNFYHSRGLNLPITTDFKIQRNLDLLKHFVVYDEVPWWANQSKIFKKNVSNHIQEFSLQLLSQDPDRWVQNLSLSGQAIQVYGQLVNHMNNQQFDRIILALSPRFGGFVVSFNLLLSRADLGLDEKQWKMFVLEYMLRIRELSADNFLEHGLMKLSELLSLRLEQLTYILHGIAVSSASNGESRFRPLVDMLTGGIGDRPRQMEFVAERMKVVSFAEVLGHYLRFGSLAVGSFQSYRTYFEFILDLRMEFSRDDIHIRELIKTELKDSKVRSRLVRFESDHFLAELISILFPRAGSNFGSSSAIVHRLLIDLVGLSNDKVIHDSLFAAALEQSLGPKSESLTSDDLLSSYLKKAVQLFKLETIDKEVWLDIYALSGSLRISVEQLFFKPGSQLKLRDSSIGQKESTPKNLEPVLESEEDESLEDVPEVTLDFEVNLNNAGLVITWPYLLQYFEILGMVKDNKFKTKKMAKRGVQLLQYMATGLTSAPEHELLLNKVLCGVKLATPIPFELDVTDNEREVTNQMLKGLLQNWPRLKNTSIDALREGFLVRDGRLVETDDVWQLKVEEKTLDILMDDMPWSFGIIKLPWMDKRLMVEWK